MRLKHIYITKEGEPMANPEMELLDWPSAETRFMEYQKYHSGLLPFEDAKQVKLILASTRFTFPVWLANIIPVDLEVEVVTQWRSEATKNGILAMKGDGGLWRSMMEDDTDPNKEYRKALRIKP